MKKYIVKRLLQLIPILIGITLLSFILMQASAMDAVDVMEQNTGGAMSEAEKRQPGKSWDWTSRCRNSMLYG